MNKILLLLSICLLISFSAHAQEKSTIKGHVLDADTEEHLVGVTISVKELPGIGTVTDNSGHFTLGNIGEGNYTLEVQYLGYAPKEEKVSIDKGQNKSVTIYVTEEAHQLSEVAIESSAIKLNRETSPVIMNQLTNKTFEATSSVSLSQGLNYLPGLRVETNCQNCGTQEVRVNGLEGKYSQILVDGQPIFTSLSSLYGLEQFPVSMIQEVEVTRGGGSVLFGANAVGGTINIKTKEPIKNYYDAKYSFNLIDGKAPDNIFGFNASFVDNTQKNGISFSGQMRHRNPWDANNDGFSEIGKNRAGALGVRTFNKLTAHDKLNLEYHYIKEFRRGGDNISRPPHEAEIAEQTDYEIHSGQVKYQHMSEDHKRILSVHSSLQKTGRDAYFGEGKDISGYSKTDELAFVGSVRYEINMDKLLFMPAKFTFGYTQEYRHLTDSIYDRDIDQKVNVSSGYVQNEWRTDRFSYIVGLRIDKHSKIKKLNVIPRTSMRYKINNMFNLRASYGMGYQAPEIIGSDLDIPIINGKATITVLAKDLKREISHTVNGGFDFRWSNDKFYSYFLVEGFYTKINDVFVDVEAGPDDGFPDNGNIYMLRTNGNGAYVTGINLETNIQPIDWIDIQAGFTFQRSRYTKAIRWSTEDYVAPVKNMLRSPNRYGYLTATFRPKNSYSFSLSNTYTGPMYVAHFAGAEGVTKDETVKTKDFYDVTVKGAYYFTLNNKHQIELNAGVKNVFNQIQKDYDKGPNRDSNYIYGPSLPRTYFVGFKINSI